MPYFKVMKSLLLPSTIKPEDFFMILLQMSSAKIADGATTTSCSELVFFFKSQRISEEIEKYPNVYCSR
jgi:hypothetical protein